MASRSMTRTAFFVLTALADQPRHGYGILREVEEMSEETVQLRVGTLYGVLDRLTADGLITLDREEVQQGRLRRYYRLTDEGVEALDAEAQRMAAGASAARQRIEAGRRDDDAPQEKGAQPKGAQPKGSQAGPGLAGGLA